ncbi:hypothetical protein [Flavobacterium luminosum]|uniref:DUF3300 domain-containing protein n=1 Tax=Flavobacterium luminosum TaxID=2949086 RepID=A0ABT0TLP9_9FLAO|nr:hypothetical protein [Flavobacterium sp. HXWNR70]MCL9808413.1 hypothetical protein [Flavobacterium sp. HXWNR70]
MKKLQFIFGAFLVLFSLESNAQVSISLNIGSRPTWHDHYHEERVQYVYLPEIECYYDTYDAVYVYYGPNGWIRSRYLPEYCHGYDINRGHRVVINYRGNSPWVNFDYHRRHYWRDNYRNYRHEYYGPNYNRRTNYVVVKERRYDNDDHYYYRNNDRGYYKKQNDRNENHGRGNGHGHGHGRR